VSVDGKRRTTGTYRLAPAGEGRTQVDFELAFEQLPRADRSMGPVVRAWLTRANRRAMERLRGVLAPGGPV